MSEYLSKEEYIAKYYNEPKQELLTDLYYKTRDNNLLQQENKQLKEEYKKVRGELLQYEIQNHNLQKSLVELRVNCGKSVY